MRTPVAQIQLANDQYGNPNYIVRKSDGLILQANSAFFQVFGIVGGTSRQIFESELLANIALFDQGDGLDRWVNCQACDGRHFLMGQNRIDLVVDAEEATLVTLWETTLQEKILNRLQLAEQIFATAMDGIVVTDSQGIIQYVNPAFIEMSGYEAQELFGMTLRVIKSGRHDDAFYQTLWNSLHTQGQWKGEVWNRRKNGDIHPEWLAISSMRDPDGKILMFTAMFRDLSERYQYEQKLSYQALHDELTGLLNRRSFHEKLNAAIEAAKQTGEQFALLYLDLDGFKQVNDSLGHEAGDQVLCAVAHRIKACCGSELDCFRMGGDEFALIVTSIEGEAENQLLRLAEQLLTTIREPISWSEVQTQVGVSIGIAIFPNDGSGGEQVMVAADHRMYAAKRAGRNRICFRE